MRRHPKNTGTAGKKLDTKVLGRLMKYIFKNYKVHYIFVLIGIVISSLASVSASLFMKTLLDDYVQPLIGVSNPNFEPLYEALSFMAIIYLLGVIATYAYEKLLVIISQGTLENIRRDLFSHMQKLPISYFDSHSHGDVIDRKSVV